MENVVTTKPRFWIYSLNESDADEEFEFKALKFDTSAGFGASRPSFYEGTVYCLAGDDKVHFDTFIERAHAVRHGFYYTIKPTDASKLPSPPFLLTSEINIGVIYRGFVEINPHKTQMEFMDYIDHEEWFSVGSSTWFGVAQRVRSEGFLFNLTAFGNPTQTLAQEPLFVGQELIELDTGMKFGNIADFKSVT